MLPRIVALLIALALFWSGYTVTRDGSSAFAATPIAEQAQAGPAADSHARSAMESTQPGSDESSDDSLPETQHLPSQAEGPSDLPEVIIVLVPARPPGATGFRPQAGVLSLQRSPFLDGPQRPPCQPRLLG